MEMENGIAVVRVVRVKGPDGERFIIQRCPFCGRRHIHGAAEGHRKPHCPLDKEPPGGYILREAVPDDDSSSDALAGLDRE